MSGLTSSPSGMRHYAAGLLFAIRILRRPGVAIWALFATLVFAITTLTLTISLTHSVRDALRQSAEQTIGGDISLRLFHRPPSASERDFLGKFGTLSLSAEQRVMIRTSSDSSGILSELKAIDRTYPLFGTLSLSNGIALQDALADQDGVPGTVVDQSFLDQSGLALNDVITIGQQPYQIRAVLMTEPERTFRLFSLGPRVLVDLAPYQENLMSSSGKQIYWYSRLKRPDSSPLSNDQIIAEIEQRFPDSGWRIVNATDGIPGIERIGEFASAFVSLVGIAIFAITMTAIRNALRADLSARQHHFAILRSIGTRPAQLRFAIACQITLITLAAIITSSVLTLVIMHVIAPMLAAQLGITVTPALADRALIIGFVTGFMALVAIPPIRAACESSPASLFRHQATKTGSATSRQQNRGWLRYLLPVLLSLVTIGFAMRLIDLGWFGLVLILMLGLCLAGFGGLGLLIGKSAGLLANRYRGAPAIRLALRNISRKSAPTVTIITSFGLAVSCLFAVILFGIIAGHHLKSVVPVTTPDLVFFDLPPDQGDAFKSAAFEDPATLSVHQMPFLHGRVTRIKDISVHLLDIPRRFDWFIRGDRGISWAAEPTDVMRQNPLITGKWWAAESRNERLASLDAEIAKALDITVGDHITLNILGQPFDIRIANLRKIDWTRLDLDFPVILSPMDPPFDHGVISAVKLAPPANRADEVGDKLQTQFPATPMIKVADVLDRLSVLFDQVLLVLLALTILATVGAVLVILTGLIALRRRATEDLAMLRALGVQPGQIIRTGALETGIVVMTSGACAMIAGTIIALIAAFAIGSMQATAIAGLVGPVGLGSFGVICVIGFGGGWILQAASLRSQSGWRG